jgi:hypothetical protein
MSPEYFAVHAQGGVPAIGGGPLSARPPAGQPGRLYVSNEGAIYRDSGAAWSALSGDDAASVLAKLLEVDGAGSGLDADTLDGVESTGFALANDARLRVIRDEGVAATNRPAIDFTGAGVIVSDDSVGGRTQVNISGTAAGAASETAAGIGEIGTDVEIQTVVTGSAFRDFLVSVFRLREELDRRLTPEAWITPTLTNGWVNYGAPRQNMSFRKTPTGDVVIRGSVKNGANNTVVFTLPVGYRPAAERVFSVAVGGPGGVGTAVMQPEGTVIIGLGNGTNVQVNVEVRCDV